MILTIFDLFFSDTATTEIYTLSLHDALPIYFVNCDLYTRAAECGLRAHWAPNGEPILMHLSNFRPVKRSEEHTSELQSPVHLVCRLLLEKKNRELYRHPPFHLCNGQHRQAVV